MSAHELLPGKTQFPSLPFTTPFPTPSQAKLSADISWMVISIR